MDVGTGNIILLVKHCCEVLWAIWNIDLSLHGIQASDTHHISTRIKISDANKYVQL